MKKQRKIEIVKNTILLLFSCTVYLMSSDFDCLDFYLNGMKIVAGLQNKYRILY